MAAAWREKQRAIVTGTAETKGVAMRNWRLAKKQKAKEKMKIGF